LENAKKLLFEEHNVCDFNEMMVDKDVPYEMLHNYLEKSISDQNKIISDN